MYVESHSAFKKVTHPPARVHKSPVSNDFCFNKFILFIFIFGCVGSLLLCVEAALRCSARASHCSGFSCCVARALGARASVVVAHGLICSVACGIFADQGLNPCPLHW